MITIQTKMCYNKRKYHLTKFGVLRAGILEELTSGFIHEGRLSVTKEREKDHSS